MHATRLIFDALPLAEREPLPAVPAPGICCITGEAGDCVPRAELLGKSFTEQHLLKAPDSPLVGVPAWCALKYRWERMGSWLCDGQTFARLDRLCVREHVIGGVRRERWGGYVTTSYKKHGAMKAPVNSGARQVWQFEMVQVDCSDRAKLAAWWDVLNRALREGIGRQSMEALDMPPAVMRKVGIAKWEAFRAWARDKHRSGLYALLCYLLPSQEELKKEAPRDELFAA